MKKIGKKIKRKLNSKFYLFLIFLATLFMGVGYSSINSVIFNINGSLKAQVQDGVFITDYEYVKSNNAYEASSEIISIYQTMLNSSIMLSEVDSDSSITYNITIYNSTGYNYIFMGVSYEEEFYDNENITYTLSNLDIGNRITSGDSLTFSITFKYVDGVDLGVSNFNNVLNSFLNFDFECEPTPKLTNNMVPVYYDSGEWKKTDVISDNWFNYNNGVWANAITYRNDLIYNRVENNSELKVFNGVDDYVYLGSENYDFAKNISLVARVKLSAYATTTYGIIGNLEQAGFYLLKNKNNKFSFQIYNIDNSKYIELESTITPKLDTWYTVVATYDGQNMKLYINGVLDSILPFSNFIPVSEAPVVIGGNPKIDGTVNSGHYNGVISDVAVMTETLTEDVIAQDYGININHTPDRYDTLYYLKFDADNGFVQGDSTTNEDGMVFDGSSNYVSVGYSAYDFSNAFTVGARVKIFSFSDQEYGIIGNSQQSGFYLAKSTGNKFRFMVYNDTTGAYVNVNSPSVIELNTWYNVVATFNGSSLKLYLNGELVATKNATVDMKISNIPIILGANPTINSTLGGGYLDGIISDILLVDEALTESQISRYYSTSLQSIVSNKTLISYNLRSYESIDNGSVIPNEMINTMWVWVPRFNMVTPKVNGEVDLEIVEARYEAHDAFNFGGEQLDGFWMGKFENSVNVASTNTNSNILIRPNSNSFTNKNIGSMFNSIKNIISLRDIYGFIDDNNNLLDSHMIKNNEWAAVAYLAQSKYGLCKNGICNVIGENDTNYITGGSNYASNVGQSTTGNIYGVYDMNGGAVEFVMGNYNNMLNTLDGFSTIPDSKYLNVYTTEDDYSFNNLQHGMLETNNLFNSTVSNFVTSSDVWMTRDNLFSYNNNTGAENINIASRSVLVVK